MGNCKKEEEMANTETDWHEQQTAYHNLRNAASGLLKANDSPDCHCHVESSKRKRKKERDYNCTNRIAQIKRPNGQCKQSYGKKKASHTKLT